MNEGGVYAALTRRSPDESISDRCVWLIDSFIHFIMYFLYGASEEQVV